MNLEKFTERSRGFVQAAQTIAMRESHQQLAPEHLLKALMDDEEGMAANLIRKAGGEPKRVVEAVDAAMAQDPEGVRATPGRSILRARPAGCSTRPRSSPRRPATASCRSSGF